MTAPLFWQAQAAHVAFGPVVALRDVSLRIAAGEQVALVGPNGSGKSTLLRLINRLVPARGGTVEWAPQGRQAMVFQRPHMLRTSALHNVALGLWIAGVPWRDARQRALGALARVGLADVAQRGARGLSGGQQQRLALARAWALAPHMLLLDEPTASLDPHAKQQVEALMAELAGAGMGLIFASHNLGQVKRLASRVIYLQRGRVLADLPVADFFDAARLEACSSDAALFVKGERI